MRYWSNRTIIVFVMNNKEMQKVAVNIYFNLVLDIIDYYYYKYLIKVKVN